MRVLEYVPRGHAYDPATKQVREKFCYPEYEIFLVSNNVWVFKASRCALFMLQGTVYLTEEDAKVTYETFNKKYPKPGDKLVP